MAQSNTICFSFARTVLISALDEIRSPQKVNKISCDNGRGYLVSGANVESNLALIKRWTAPVGDYRSVVYNMGIITT